MSHDDPFRLMTLPAPAMEQDAVSAFVAGHFGLEGDLKPLVSERDQNFRLTTGDGSRYVVKIYNPGESTEVLDFQARAPGGRVRAGACGAGRP